MTRTLRLGTAAGSRPVALDLDTLLRTRLLIQSNSGGGKSWLLRRIAEQGFGKIPILLIDPEGEFATLREKYGYVLVGPGGETPADIRSAGLVAQRLLELHASAVCDLYEMRPTDRHEWVRRFLTALIEAPKKLWQPVLVIVDEAHVFCPEKGSGESAAAEAMISLSTRGRKRGFCAVWATQRLAKVRKDAAAELQNVLIGPTFMDADRERAADALGVTRAAKEDFFMKLRLLAPGHFFALGRAVSTEVLGVQIGPVETTHPEAGSAKHGAAPPPAPEKIRPLLPKLADLPAEAEEQAKTLEQAQGEIRALRVQLREAQKAQPVAKASPIKMEAVKIPAMRRVEQIIERAEQASQRLRDAARALRGSFDGAAKQLEQRLQKAVEPLDRALDQADTVGGRLADLSLRLGSRVLVQAPEGVEISTVIPRAWVEATKAEYQEKLVAARAQGWDPVTGTRIAPRPAPAALPPTEVGEEKATSAEARIIRALIWWKVAGIDEPTRHQVAFAARYTVNGYIVNTLGALRAQGRITYPAPGKVALVGPIPPEMVEGMRRPTRTVLFDRVRSTLKTEARRRIFQALVDNGEEMPRSDLAKASGYTVNGYFVNELGALSSVGIVVYPRSGYVKLAPMFEALPV